MRACIALVAILALSSSVSVFCDARGAADREHEERSERRRDEALAKFRDWFAENGGVANKVQVQRINPRDVGVVALEDIAAGETVLSVPLSLIVTREDAMGSFLEKYYEEVDGETNFMALYIIYENSRPESKWRAYWDALPHTVYSTLWFGDFEYEKMQASRVKEFSIQRSLAIIKAHERILEKIIEANPVDFPYPMLYFRGSFQWALSIIWSRTFSIRVLDTEDQWQKTAGLVPYADFVNTNVESLLNIDCKTNDAGSHFECYATQDIAQGGQLYGPYGSSKEAMPNGRLLMDYGFLLPNTEHDVALVEPPQWTDRVPDADKKKAVLETLGIADVPIFHIVRNKGIDIAMMAYFRVLCATSVSLADPNYLAQQLQKGVALSDEEEECTFGLLRRYLQDALDSYGSTIDTDRREVEKLRKRSYLGKEQLNLINIGLLRIGEKVAIYDALNGVGAANKKYNLNSVYEPIFPTTTTTPSKNASNAKADSDSKTATDEKEAKHDEL
eukprot:Opistho-2@91522